MDGERNIHEMHAENWTWLATSNRLLRYMERADESIEMFQDASYGEIASIEMGSERQEKHHERAAWGMLTVGALLIPVAIVIGMKPLGIGVGLLGVALMVLSAFLWVKRDVDERFYVRFHGSIDETGDWTAGINNVDEKEVARFTRSVRKGVDKEYEY